MDDIVRATVTANGDQVRCGSFFGRALVGLVRRMSCREEVPMNEFDDDRPKLNNIPDISSLSQGCT
jgi:hypothetical protein